MSNAISTMKASLWMTFIVMFSLSSVALSQSTWQLNPFEKKLFIENKGQFDIKNNLASTPILFGIDEKGTKIFFTKKGLIYCIDQLEKANALSPIKKDDSFEKKEAKKLVLNSYIFSMQWLNANPAVELIAEEKSDEYFTNEMTKESAKDAAHGFKKITYKNLYANIDVSYTFHSIEGIKYNITLHPGADPSAIKMMYTGLEKLIKDDQGNIHLNLVLGDIIDHAPKTFYAETEAEIPSSFTLNNNIISFQLDAYDSSKTVIIDPWVTLIALQMTANAKAFDVERDGAGNVYLYGGFSPYKVAKYSPTGVPIWTYSTTFTSTSYYGDIAVHPNGESYITGGCCTGDRQKLRTNGTTVWSKSGGYEAWNIAINNCNPTQVVVAGYQISGGTGLLGKLNLSNGNYSSLSNPPVTTEYRSLTIPPNGNVYGLTCPSLAGPGNSIVATSPALALIYSISSNYLTMAETGNLYTTSSEGGFAGQNGIAADRCYLYTTNGGVLDKRNISNGEIINSVSIPGGIPESNSGVVVDSCGFVYVGSQTGVYKFDYNLIQVATASTTAAIYGLALGSNRELLACGNGFVASLALDVCNPVSCTQNSTLTLSSTDATCGTASGSATVIINNGSLPYTYLWSDGQTTATAVNLIPGTYTVTATAACITLTGTIIVGNINGGTVAVSKTDVSCFGGSDGQAVATVVGGTAPYTYSWSSSSSGNSDTLKNLPAGTYTVVVSDSKNCIQTGTIIINEPTAFTATTSSTPSDCGQNIGSVSITPNGGAAPYTYLWSPSGQTTATATNLAAGIYTCTVTSSNNCSQNFSVTVINANGPQLLIASQKNVSCNGNNDGSAIATVSGGTAPYGFLWSLSGNTNDTITGLSPGNYTCTITDNTGCQDVKAITITQPNALTAKISQNNASCNSYADGVAIVTPSGGSPKYTYTWTPTNAPDSLIQGLKAGNYNVTIQDLNNCLLNASITITEPSPLNATIVGKTSICSGGTTTLTAGGGITYLWNTGESTAAIAVKPISTTIYSVTVTGANGCKANKSQQVSVFQSPDPEISGKNILCVGDSAILTATGGGTYSWVTGETTSKITVKPTVSRTYNVTVTGSNGCSDFAAFPITVNPNPIASINGNSSVCEGETITLTASGGDNYQWDTGEDTPFINANPTDPTTYTVIVINDKGCKDTVTQSITIDTLPIPLITGKNNICEGESTTLTASGGDTYVWNTGETTDVIIINPKLGASYSVIAINSKNCAAETSFAIKIISSPVSAPGNDTIVCSGSIINLNGKGGNPTTARYLWSPANLFNNPKEPQQELPVNSIQELKLFLTVTDNGCTDTDTLIITVDPCELPGEVIPTDIFSPNGDGNNDKFLPFTKNIASYNLRIFNRWGEQIFESKETNLGWDGNHAHEETPQNVYVYLIVATARDGEIIIKTGTVMVVR